MFKRTTRGSTKANASEDPDTPDNLYIPSEAVHREGDEEVEDDWEIAALTWGMISVLGLGTSSAGIFGAETVAR